MHVLRIMSRNMPKLQACSIAKQPNQYFHIFHFCDLVVGTETGSDRKFSINCLFDFFFMPSCQFHVLCQFSFLNFSVSFLLNSPFIFFFYLIPFFSFSFFSFYIFFPCYFLFLSTLLAFLGFYPLVSRFYLPSTPFSFFLFSFIASLIFFLFSFILSFYLFTP